MSSEFANEYYAQLLDLTFNSKPLITALSQIAGEHVLDGSVVVELILRRIQLVQILKRKKKNSKENPPFSLLTLMFSFSCLTQAPADQQLPLFYLIDSIVKNEGHTFRTLFLPALPGTFVDVYMQSKESFFFFFSNVLTTTQHNQMQPFVRNCAIWLNLGCPLVVLVKAYFQSPPSPLCSGKWTRSTVLPPARRLLLLLLALQRLCSVVSLLHWVLPGLVRAPLRHQSSIRWQCQCRPVLCLCRAVCLSLSLSPVLLLLLLLLLLLRRRRRPSFRTSCSKCCSRLSRTPSACPTTRHALLQSICALSSMCTRARSTPPLVALRRPVRRPLSFSGWLRTAKARRSSCPI
jgi:hypothetical protein